MSQESQRNLQEARKCLTNLSTIPKHLLNPSTILKISIKIPQLTLKYPRNPSFIPKLSQESLKYPQNIPRIPKNPSTIPKSSTESLNNPENTYKNPSTIPKISQESQRIPQQSKKYP